MFVKAFCRHHLHTFNKGSKICNKFFQILYTLKISCIIIGKRDNRKLIKSEKIPTKETSVQ